MTERPILFSAPMVRALLDGRKTQTRRIVKVTTGDLFDVGALKAAVQERIPAIDSIGGVVGTTSRVIRCPYGLPGDRLWVREAHAIVPRTAYARSEGVQQALRPDDDHDACVYREGWERCRPGKWRPSIHMPRWASRLTLEITDVRVERLQDCSERDAIAEGLQVKDQAFMPSYRGADDLPWRAEFPRDAYADLWDKINGKGSWAANPWVWAVSFRVKP